MNKDIFTDKELGELNKLTDDLIITLFCQPNNRAYSINNIIKKAYLLGRNKKSR